MNAAYKVETLLGEKPPSTLIYFFLLLIQYYLYHALTTTNVQAPTCDSHEKPLSLGYFLEKGTTSSNF